MSMPEGHYERKRESRVKFHPDDPRASCHCQLLKRPVAECETGSGVRLASCMAESREIAREVYAAAGFVRGGA